MYNVSCLYVYFARNEIIIWEYAHRIPACRLKWCPDGSATISVRLRRHPMYLLPGCRCKTLPTFSNLSCQIPTQPLLHMVQDIADWVAPFPIVSIPLLLPSNSSTFLFHLPRLLLSYMCTRVKGTYHHHPIEGDPILWYLCKWDFTFLDNSSATIANI